MLLICSAFCSSAETALFSLNSVQVHRIRKERPRAADRIDAILSRPGQLLSTILIGNTLVNVAAAGVGYSLAEYLYPSHGEEISIPAMTVILLILGEVTPKRLAMRIPEQLAVFYSLVLLFLIKALTPLRIALEGIAGVFQKDIHVLKRSLTEDEFLTVVEVGEEEGVIDEEERTMVDGIIRLEQTQASDVMTPRVDLTGVYLEEPVEDAEKIARHARFRYLPVFAESPDNIHGFLDVHEFLLAEERDLLKAMLPPFFVPETASLDQLLTTFQVENKRVAIVVDEYGGTAGLITRGDVLDEIAEDVSNEQGDDNSDIRKVGENQWIISGNLSLEDVNYELGMSLEADGVDRISGWLIAKAGSIPHAGDMIESQGCRVTVQLMRRNRIVCVLLEKLSKDESREGAR